MKKLILALLLMLSNNALYAQDVNTSVSCDLIFQKFCYDPATCATMSLGSPVTVLASTPGQNLGGGTCPSTHPAVGYIVSYPSSYTNCTTLSVTIGDANYTPPACWNPGTILPGCSDCTGSDININQTHEGHVDVTEH